jgi:hypothetical protein
LNSFLLSYRNTPHTTTKVLPASLLMKRELRTSSDLLLLEFLLVSRNQEDRIMVRFAKWRARDIFVCVSVCGL